MFSPLGAPKAADQKTDPSGQVDVWERQDEDSIKYFAKNDFT
jgi:hypothetical protein